jgi:hypothetical protein
MTRTPVARTSLRWVQAINPYTHGDCQGLETSAVVTNLPL